MIFGCTQHSSRKLGSAFVCTKILHSTLYILHLRSTLFLQEGAAHGREGVDEHTVLDALATMFHVGNLHQHVAGTHNLGDSVDGKLEGAALHVSNLAMRMAMELALRALLELHLHHHHIVVIAHYLAIHLAGISRALPFLVLVKHEGFALGGDVASIDHLSVVGRGNHAMRSSGVGTVGDAFFITFIRLVALATYEQEHKGSH